MASKGSVRIIRVDFADRKLEKRALFLRHKALPEPRVEFKEWVCTYLLNLASSDLADDVRQLMEEDQAIETEQSDKQLAKFSQEDIEAYLARKKEAIDEATDE